MTEKLSENLINESRNDSIDEVYIPPKPEFTFYDPLKSALTLIGVFQYVHTAIMLDMQLLSTGIYHTEFKVLDGGRFMELVFLEGPLIGSLVGIPIQSLIKKRWLSMSLTSLFSIIGLVLMIY